MEALLGLLNKEKSLVGAFSRQTMWKFAKSCWLTPLMPAAPASRMIAFKLYLPFVPSSLHTAADTFFIHARMVFWFCGNVIVKYWSSSFISTGLNLLTKLLLHCSLKLFLDFGSWSKGYMLILCLRKYFPSNQSKYVTK